MLITRMLLRVTLSLTAAWVGALASGCSEGADDASSNQTGTGTGESAIVGDGLRTPASVMDDLIEYQPFVGTMNIPGSGTRTVKLSVSRRATPEHAGMMMLHVCATTDVDACGGQDGAPELAFTLDRSSSGLWYNVNLRITRDEAIRRTHSLDYQRTIHGSDVGGLVPTIKPDTAEISLLVPRRFVP